MDISASTTLRTAAQLVPFKRQALALGTRLPPSAKGPALIRAMEALRRYGGAPSRITTNFGIRREYHIEADGTAEGTLLYGRPEDYAGERGCLELAAWLAPDCDAFLDIGAYRGYYIFYIRHAVAKPIPIYWFEPAPALYHQLHVNVIENGLHRVYGLPCAIGARDGEAQFYLDLDDPTSNSLGEWFGQKHRLSPITVPVTTFARFAHASELERCFVKVDVENAEFDFLNGARPALDRIRYLIMEVLGPAIDAEFVRAVIQEGLHAYYINDRVLEHSPDGAFTYVPPQYNWLFCRETPREMAHRLMGSGLTVRH